MAKLTHINVDKFIPNKRECLSERKVGLAFTQHEQPIVNILIWLVHVQKNTRQKVTKKIVIILIIMMSLFKFVFEC